MQLKHSKTGLAIDVEEKRHIMKKNELVFCKDCTHYEIQTKCEGIKHEQYEINACMLHSKYSHDPVSGEIVISEFKRCEDVNNDCQCNDFEDKNKTTLVLNE